VNFEYNRNWPMMCVCVYATVIIFYMWICFVEVF